MTVALDAVESIVRELRVLWPPPKTVKSDEDAAVYLKAWASTVLDESQDGREITDVWHDLRRLHVFHCWPTAGELCELIRKHRRDRPRPPKQPALPDPRDFRDELWTPAQWQRHLAAMREAHDAQALRPNRFMARVIVMGEMMMARQEKLAKQHSPSSATMLM